MLTYHLVRVLPLVALVLHKKTPILWYYRTHNVYIKTSDFKYVFVK